MIEDSERKRKYAFQLLREPDELFKAGLAAYPEQSPYHHAMAFKIATEWANDEEVLVITKALIDEHGADFFLPSKYDVGREVWKVVKSGKDKLAAAKLYAELMGFIEKPAQAVIHNSNTQTINKVMIVPTSVSDDAWEEKLALQQMKLVEAA